jgi:hypothetical protein
MGSSRRALAAAAIAGLLLGTAVSTPARAVDPPLLLAGFAGGGIGVPPAPAKTFPMIVKAHKETNPKLFISLDEPIPGEVTLADPPGCTQAGTEITCAWASAVYVDVVIPLTFRATAAAQAPGQVTVTFWMSSDTETGIKSTASVTIGDSIDLVTEAPRTVQAHAEQHVGVPLKVTNLGSRTVAGMRITLYLSASLLPQTFDNCSPPEPTDVIGSQSMVCEFPDLIAPGQAVALDDGSGGFGVDVAGDSPPNEFVYLDAQGLSEAPAAGAPATSRPRAASGRKLRLVPAGSSTAVDPPVDNDPADNFSKVTVQVIDSHRDIEMIGATASGRVGDTVTIKVGLVDNGPAALDNLTNSGYAFAFLVPKSTQVTDAPLNCASDLAGSDVPIFAWGRAGGASYLCVQNHGFVAPHSPELLEFTLKIMNVVPNDKGNVATLAQTPALVWRVPSADDDNPGNDIADVVINPSNTAPAGGTGLASLPVTGAPLAVIAMVGGLILVAGAGLVLLSRTRRRV